MFEVKVPAMGESITEGTISKWVAKVGDAVKQGDLLLELETDKVNLEISAEQDGVLQQILRKEGDTVQIGEVVGMIGAEQAGQAQTGQMAQVQAGQAQVQSGHVAQGHVAQGQAEQVGQAQVQSGQTAQGQAEQIGQAAGAATKPEAAAAASTAVTSTNEQTEPAGAGDSAGLSATPAARKLARERGIDLGQVEARDPLGRVYPADVLSAGSSQDTSGQSGSPSATSPSSAGASAVGAPATDASTTSAVASAAAPAPGSAIAGKSTSILLAGKPHERTKMSRRRATIAKRLVEAQHNAAMLTTFNEVDMTAILEVRKRRKESFKVKFDVNLGFMSFFTKAVVGALKAFPLLNAEIDGEDIITKQYYDIGIAVAAKEGLIVPVVRDADRLSFAEIERTIGQLAAKARSNTLELSDLQGGTFTITNGGVFGSLLSTPILNAPQVGILGMHKIQLRPIALDQERMANRPMMYLALSYDHRIVDGAEAVQFLVKMKELLEDPETLLLEG